VTGDAAIQIRGLSKDYGRGHGLFGLDLDVERGEVLGFLGPNGAGKSTTMRLLLDLIRPTAGTATLLGLDSRAQSLEIRRRIGFLPGDFALYPKLTGAALLDHLAESCAAASTAGCAPRSPSASTRSSTGRCASSRPATARSSASSERSCTSPSC
jgi:ABC-2 type transport system ATP-binding protein